MACDCHPQTDLCDSCTELLATGAEEERDRIIALLETELGETSQNEVWISLARAIALIKGENK